MLYDAQLSPRVVAPRTGFEHTTFHVEDVHANRCAMNASLGSQFFFLFLHISQTFRVNIWFQGRIGTMKLLPLKIEILRYP